MGGLELNRIYHMDCIEGMRKIADNSVDLIITSPPYDNLRKYKGFSFEFEKVADELYRITKQGGIVVWIVSDATIDGSETGTSFKQAIYFKEIGFNLHDTMIWLKTNPMPQVKRKRYTNTFEFMFILSKGYPNTCNYITEPCKNAGKDMSKSSFKNYSANDSKRFMKNTSVNKMKIKNNVWEYKIGAGSGDDKIARTHPATFPEKLAEDHIISWSNPNDIVLDPFMGSGTVAKMAIINNRNFYGFEISAEYTEIANNRIKNLLIKRA